MPGHCVAACCVLLDVMACPSALRLAASAHLSQDPIAATVTLRYATVTPRYATVTPRYVTVTPRRIRSPQPATVLCLSRQLWAVRVPTTAGCQSLCATTVSLPPTRTPTVTRDDIETRLCPHESICPCVCPFRLDCDSVASVTHVSFRVEQICGIASRRTSSAGHSVAISRRCGCATCSLASTTCPTRTMATSHRRL